MHRRAATDTPLDDSLQVMTATSLRLPDFIIAGAPRCGTTWLYELLERHPSIHLARPRRPEPKFFLVDDAFAKGLEYYSKTWFADVSAGKVAGEKSSNYLESATAARRMAQAVPGAKLLFLLRNPVDRAYSNYLWSRRNGLEAASFAEALALEDERERTVAPALRFARPHAYFSRGLYAQLLAPYLELFGSGSVLCLRYEDIVDSPSELACRVHEFLGVEPRPADAAALGVVNASDPTAAPMPDQVRSELTWRYLAPNERLYQLLGGDFRPWR